MRYSNYLHEFIEMMQSTVGVPPNHFEHHVLVEVRTRVAFAHFDPKTRDWYTFFPYPSYSMDDAENLIKELQLAIDEYEEKHPELYNPPVVEEAAVGEKFRTGAAFTVIKGNVSEVNPEDFSDEDIIDADSE